ncbi:MAG: GNAT family N-acetyltransferase [Candidatus Roizmanbacteria bacterium]|nr:GNAT family N-acetyltransferase [Candidatus Roizmanbacteria bacterium]
MKPGEIIKTFTSKSGEEVILRYPKKEDLDELLFYINELSKEDTYIRFSGEVISRDSEKKFLDKTVDNIMKGDAVMVCAFINNHLIGVSGIERNTENKQRSRHIGDFGISLRKDFRGNGIGRVLLQTVLAESKKLPNLAMTALSVFATNIAAQKLYISGGFIIYGRLPGGVLHRGKYVDLISMYKKL